MNRPCTGCGGTGDKFDREKDDWVPGETCPKCGGTGEEPEEEQEEK